MEYADFSRDGRTIGSQFEALFEYATIGILLTNRRGEIVNFNSLAEKQFGYHRDELIGKPVEELLPDDIRQRHVALKSNFMEHPGNRPMGSNRDLFAKRKDGTVFPVEVSLSHFNLEGDTFVIAFIIDITVRKRNEEAIQGHQKELERVSRQIRKLNSELEQKVEDRTKMLREALSELERSGEELTRLLQKEKELGDMKSKFVTMASHEFRTPLSTILSSASLIRKYDAPEDADKREKHLNRIRHSVENMRDILEDFLSLGKMEEGLIHLHPEVLTAAELEEEIQRIANEMQALTRRGEKIRYVNTVDRNLSIDIKLLRHVLTNLISNAIKFSLDGQLVEVTSSIEEEKLKLTVTDHGIGISKEDQQHLFERFFRGENAANIQGTGLGLYIISRYMELAKGSIDLHSELEKGTTFTLLLPLEYPAEQTGQ
ncbi:MAG: ATP-binding protein [Bacteroidota bacterium]